MGEIRTEYSRVETAGGIERPMLEMHQHFENQVATMKQELAVQFADLNQNQSNQRNQEDLQEIEQLQRRLAKCRQDLATSQLEFKTLAEMFTEEQREQICLKEFQRKPENRLEAVVAKTASREVIPNNTETFDTHHVGFERTVGTVQSMPSRATTPIPIHASLHAACTAPDTPAISSQACSPAVHPVTISNMHSPVVTVRSTASSNISSAIASPALATAGRFRTAPAFLGVSPRTVNSAFNCPNIPATFAGAPPTVAVKSLVSPLSNSSPALVVAAPLAKASQPATAVMGTKSSSGTASPVLLRSAVMPGSVALGSGGRWSLGAPAVLHSQRRDWEQLQAQGFRRNRG